MVANLHKFQNGFIQHLAGSSHSLITLMEEVVLSSYSEPMTGGTYTRAFVIKFANETNLSGNIAEGRVEHVSSGMTFKFQSIPQMLAFMDKILRESAVPQASAKAP